MNFLNEADGDWKYTLEMSDAEWELLTDRVNNALYIDGDLLELSTKTYAFTDVDSILLADKPAGIWGQMPNKKWAIGTDERRIYDKAIQILVDGGFAGEEADPGLDSPAEKPHATEELKTKIANDVHKKYIEHTKGS